jgi:hypothetical protein
MWTLLVSGHLFSPLLLPTSLGLSHPPRARATVAAAASSPPPTPSPSPEPIARCSSQLPRRRRARRAGVRSRPRARIACPGTARARCSWRRRARSQRHDSLRILCSSSSIRGRESRSCSSSTKRTSSPGSDAPARLHLCG